MKKKLIAAVLAAACTVVSICACSPKEEQEENVFTGSVTKTPSYQAHLDAISPEAYSNMDGLDLEPGTYISVIGKDGGTPYWSQIQAGVAQAASDLNKALGYEGNDKIKVLFNAPSGENIDEQVNILDEELARYPDVIAIASIDDTASSVQFDLAAENGIPIVAFDSGNTYQGIQCTCRTDNAKAAAEGAKRLCGYIEESGEVLILIHDSTSENAKERAAAIQEELRSNHPDVTEAETIYIDQLTDLKRKAAAEQLGIPEEELAKALAGEEEKPEQTEEAGAEPSESPETEEEKSLAAKLQEIDKAADAMSDEDAIIYVMAKHPEIKGICATDAVSSQLAVSTLKKAEKAEEITIVGFDAGRAQIDSLKNGEIKGLIVQNPFGMGYSAVIAAARTVLEIGNEARVDTGYIWADADNMNEKEISGMLYE